MHQPSPTAVLGPCPSLLTTLHARLWGWERCGPHAQGEPPSLHPPHCWRPPRAPPCSHSPDIAMLSSRSPSKSASLPLLLRCPSCPRPGPAPPPPPSPPIALVRASRHRCTANPPLPPGGSVQPPPRQNKPCGQIMGIENPHGLCKSPAWVSPCCLPLPSQTSPRGPLQGLGWGSVPPIGPSQTQLGGHRSPS
mgnify:CR=1 FL=1